MPVLNCTLQGRFGNQCMIWLFCRGLAARFGYDLCCDPWVGEKVFDIPTAPKYTGSFPLPRFNELTIWEALSNGQDVEFRGYAQTLQTQLCGQAQMRNCMIYSKRQVQSWLPIRPDLLPILERIREHHFRNDAIVAHLRADDYLPLGYPVINSDAFRKAAMLYFGFGRSIEFVSQEYPTPHRGLPDELSFLPDFYRLMMAPTLMRANSTFSFLAGLLGNGLVLSPRIDGLQGGIEHDNVKFEAGNHCRLADFSFCSDLHVAP